MMKKNYKLIIGIIIGLTLGSIGVYATTLLASEVPYTNNNQQNVQGAIDDLYAKVKKPLCKSATTLHTETCSQTSTSSYCRKAGYAAEATITYGNLGTSGTLSSGDAFDCDVDGNGTYDEDERFYFVSYKYTGGTTGYETFDTNTAVLIYYSNVSEGIANNTVTYAYNDDTNKINYNGPIIAVQQLPKTSGTNAWSRLKSTKRIIVNEKGENYYGTDYKYSGNGKDAYDYSIYASRLLTYQELLTACGSGTPIDQGYLDKCQYLMENTRFSNNSYTYGYWLETPVSSNSDSVWIVSGSSRNVHDYYANNAGSIGVRPAIDVSLSDIEY